MKLLCSLSFNGLEISFEEHWWEQNQKPVFKCDDVYSFVASYLHVSQTGSDIRRGACTKNRIFGGSAIPILKST